MKNDDRSYRAAAREAMEARFARSVAACLSESADQVSRPTSPSGCASRREKSLEASRRARGNAQGLGVTASGAAIAGFSQSRWWLRFASVLPLVALVGGLALIQDWQNRDPDLGRRRGRRGPARRRPADQRLSRSGLLGVPEGAARTNEPSGDEARAEPPKAAPCPSRPARRFRAADARRRCRRRVRSAGRRRRRRALPAPLLPPPAPSREEGVRWQASRRPSARRWRRSSATGRRSTRRASRSGSRWPPASTRSRPRSAPGSTRGCRVGQAHPGRARPGAAALRGSAPGAGARSQRALAAPTRRCRPSSASSSPPAPPRAASAPRRRGGSKPSKAGRDGKEAKANVVPNPALAQPPRPVAPTLVQAAPGATTTLITRRPTPPPHQQIGHAEDRDDARVREPLDPACPARTAGGRDRSRRRRRRAPGRPRGAAASRRRGALLRSRDDIAPRRRRRRRGASPPAARRRPRSARRMACFVYEATLLFGLALIPGVLGACLLRPDRPAPPACRATRRCGCMRSSSTASISSGCGRRAARRWRCRPGASASSPPPARRSRRRAPWRATSRAAAPGSARRRLISRRCTGRRRAAWPRSPPGSPARRCSRCSSRSASSGTTACAARASSTPARGPSAALRPRPR